MTKTWIKFTVSGTNFGYAHFVGDVVELEADKAKELMKQGGCIPAEEDEIKAAKAVIEKEEQKAAEAKAAQGPSNADLMAELAALKKALADATKK